ncbi:hypothetical protein DMX06_21670 [Pseudomonas mosselii]|nr:hypothetical protein DMX06_21670 [Pseudomonas mosselii]
MKNLTKTYITNSRIDFYQISKNLTRQFTFANIFKHKNSIKIYFLIKKWDRFISPTLISAYLHDG